MGRRLSAPRIAGTYLLLLLYYGFFLIPMLWIVLQSFKTSAGIFSGRLIPRLSDLTFSSYQQVWQTANFPTFFRNSTVIALGVTAVSVVVSALGAYGLSKYRIRGRRAFVVAVLASQMFPPILILVPFYTTVQALGLNDTYLGIILAHIVLALPFCLWMFKSYIDAVPSTLIEAGLVDGCSRLGAFLRIVLPTSFSGLAVVAFYAFTVSWGDYLFVSIVSGSDRTATMPLYIYRISTSLQLQWGVIAAASVLTILPVVIIFAFVQRWLVEGLLAGAVKG